MYNIEKDYIMIKSIEKQFLRHCTSLRENNSYNQPIINALKKSEKKFFYCKKIIVKSKELSKSYAETLAMDHKLRQRKNYKNTKNHKSTFYQFLKLLRRIWFFAEGKNNWDPIPSIFDPIVNKVTTPKNCNYKYTAEQVKDICDRFYKPKYKWKINRLNIWLRARKEKEFKDISLSTVCLYIKRDSRNMKLNKKKAKVKHPLRTWDIDLGNIQLDIKVVGPNENHWKRNLYIMDAKDEQSKVYWQKLLKYQTKEEMLIGVKEMINFYKKSNIKVKRVRTDNAMVFKKTNFVQTGEFNKLLASKGIEHQFIPIRQPECNGVVERQHQTLDHEVIESFSKIESLEDLQEHLNEWQEYFNHERYHTYTFIKDSKECYQIPMEFVKKYNKTVIN